MTTAQAPSYALPSPWRSPTGRDRGRVCMAGRDRRPRRCDWSGIHETPPRPVPPGPPRGRASPCGISSSRPFRMTNRHDGQSAPCYECERVSRCAHAVAGNVESRWCVPALEGLRDTHSGPPRGLWAGGMRSLGRARPRGRALAQELRRGNTRRMGGPPLPLSLTNRWGPVATIRRRDPTGLAGSGPAAPSALGG